MNYKQKNNNLNIQITSDNANLEEIASLTSYSKEIYFRERKVA